MPVIWFACGAAVTLVAQVVAQIDTGAGANWASVLNTLLLVILNIVAAKNARNVRAVRQSVDENAPGEGETVNRTRFIDQNGDEHIVIHRYQGEEGSPIGRRQHDATT